MSIWRTNIEEDMYKLRPISKSTIQEAEKLLNVSLPKEYLEILKIQNGGYIKFDTMPTPEPTSWDEDSICVDHIMGIGYDIGILDTPELIEEWDLPENIILLSGDGHSWIALDYKRKNENPPVIYLDTESGQELEVASSFRDFLNILCIDQGKRMEEKNLNIEISPFEQQYKVYYSKIDDLMVNGKPKEIDRLFTKILSTNSELIRYMVEKMRHHENPKVQYYLMLYLSECSEGYNKGTIEDDYLLEVLKEISSSKNKDAKVFAISSLKALNNRLNN